MDASGNPDEMFGMLLAKYSERHRAYHNLDHVGDCLAEFDKARSLAKNADAIEAAIWFHDAIYDSRAKDNEEQSAELAVKIIKSAGLSESFASTVTALILATKHAKAPDEPDAALLVDVDLSILGQSAERFDQYERQIRREYEWVPNDAFVAGRSAILKSFLDRSSIYTTEFFREKYESKARENLGRSLQQLASTNGAEQGK